MEFATDNFKVAQIALQEGDGLFRNVCFDCQQAVEKALKGLLTHKEKEFKKSHDLIYLNSLVKKCKIDIQADEEGLDWLANCYFETRYPDAYFETYTREDAEKALKIAQEILEQVKNRIK